MIIFSGSDFKSFGISSDGCIFWLGIFNSFFWRWIFWFINILLLFFKWKLSPDFPLIFWLLIFILLKLLLIFSLNTNFFTFLLIKLFLSLTLINKFFSFLGGLFFKIYLLFLIKFWLLLLMFIILLLFKSILLFFNNNFIFLFWLLLLKFKGIFISLFLLNWIILLFSGFIFMTFSFIFCPFWILGKISLRFLFLFSSIFIIFILFGIINLFFFWSFSSNFGIIWNRFLLLFDFDTLLLLLIFLFKPILLNKNIFLLFCFSSLKKFGFKCGFLLLILRFILLTLLSKIFIGFWLIFFFG